MESITGTVLTSGAIGTYDNNGGDFDILRDLLVTADATASMPFLDIGLVAALDTVPDLTVWAPNDDAFTGLAMTVASVTGNIVPDGEDGTIGFLADVLTLLSKGNPNGLLTDILTYHVTPGVFDLNAVLGLGDGAAVPTLLGSNLTTDFDTMPASLIDGDSVVGNPGIIATDLFASNGVIHTINGVLLPLEVAGILTAPGTDFEIGDETNEYFSTGWGDDFIEGNGGSDIIRAGAGDDVAIGGDGNDWISAGRGDDTILGESGYDKIYGGRGNDTINGGTGNDWLIGGGDDDTMLGDSGHDKIYGGRGDDTINGGTGNDWMTGGRGIDTFVFENNSGDDTIIGFRNGTDKIDLSGYEGIEDFSDVQDSINGSWFGSKIHLEDGDSIYLLGVREHQLDASDFIFV